MSDQNITPEMRREILAQYYESGKALPLDMTNYRFDMSKCGTTACIAGSAIFLFDKDLFDSYEKCKVNFINLKNWMNTVASRAAKLLGLHVPDEDAEKDPDHLFYQFDITTPQQAADALRALNVKADANV